MKNFLVIIAGLFFLVISLTGMSNTPEDSPSAAQTKVSASGTIDLVGSPELVSLVNRWASEYAQVNPGVKINIRESANQPASANSISILTSEDIPTGSEQLWKIAVGRDAVVAVFNSSNPMQQEIYTQGVTAEELSAGIADPSKRNWNSLIDKGQSASVNYFIINSEKVKENIARFTGLAATSVGGTTVATSSEIISALQKDKYAIGFCHLSDVRDAGTAKLAQGISILPVDKNKNNRLDSFENIYANMESFTRGVWAGKYPHALCSGIYAVSTAQPSDENAIAFLTWVTTEGQQYLNANGYSDLASAEVKSNKMALSGQDTEVASTPIVSTENKPVISTTWVVVILFVALAALLFVALLRYAKKQKWDSSTGELEASPVLNEDAIAAPKGLYFDKTHTWAFMEKDGNVKIGIDDFLQHVTGTLTRVIMKNTGDKVRKGEKILTIVREGKQLNIYAPISGTIIEQNATLLSDSSLVNTSPYADGWVYLIEPTNWEREMRFLFMGEKYTAWIEDELIRLKDFFAAWSKTKTPAFAHVILQDGGELADHILADLEPEVWEDFQMKFINTSR